MIKSFYGFSATKIGIVDLEIKDCLKNNLFNVRSFRTELNLENITLKDGFLLVNDIDYFLQIKDRIDFLKESIEILKNKNKKFVNLDEKSFMFYSKRHVSWRVFYVKDMESKIPDSILECEKSIFSGHKENHTYV